MSEQESEPVPEGALYKLLGAYFDAFEAGVAVDRATLLARHPDLADEIAEFFAEQDRLHLMTEPLRLVPGRSPETLAPTLLGGGPPASSGEDPLAPRTLEEIPDATAGDESWQFGEYEVVRELARGGMGVVFEARQRGLNRPVALKMILGGQLASPADRWRFRNEAEAVANLDHPHIVPVYDVGEFRGLAYYSMKLMEGGNLTARLVDGGSDPKAAARLVIAVARAVHHAHQRGVLHRDLKPSNILLDAAGVPHVADFGLARRIEADPGLTQTGAILGTPSFMAPEQASGERRAITTATDVYGLGAVLYALLTGRPPFRGVSLLETIEMVLSRRPEPPAELNRNVDRDLETICLKCLDKDPRGRYGSALGVAEDLERWLAGEPIEARPVGWTHRAWLWCRRPRRVTQAGVFALVLGLVFALWASTAFPLLLFGAIRPERPGRFVFHIARSILGFYVPMAAFGGFTAARKWWAPWAGLAHSLVCLGLSIAITLGLRLDAGGTLDIHDPGARIAIYSLLVCLSGLLVLAYLAALVSQVSNARADSRVPGPERPPAELSTLTGVSSTLSAGPTRGSS